MKSPRIFAFLVLLAGVLPTENLVGLTPSEPTIGSWPSFGNGPSHTGFYPITIGDVTVVPGWTKTFPDHPLNHVAISGGRVYATATGFNAADNNVNVPFAVALDSVTGNELWRRTLSGFPAPPAVSGESIVVQLAHSNDALYVLRANDGSVQWSRVFNSEQRFDAVSVLGDRIWANSSYGLISFRISDNSQRFFADFDDPYGCTNSYSAGVVYIAERNFFRALDAETGARLWSVPNYSQNTESAVPAVLNGRAFVVEANSRLTAIDLVTKSVRWTAFGNFSYRPATDGSRVYALEAGGINSYAADTGQLSGRYNPGFMFSEYPARGSQPLVTNDLVMIGSNRATYIFDKASFQLRTTIPKGGYLSYTGGVLYIADPVGNLVTYRFSNAAPEPSPTPSPTPTATPGPPIPADVELVSVNREGTSTANSVSSALAVSTANGRFVLFLSLATDLTSVPDNNGQSDLFLRDRRTGTIQLVTINASNTAASGPSGIAGSGAKLTPDGRFVVFTSGRDDLVPENGSNFAPDVFVRDVQAAHTIVASVGLDGQPGKGYGADISRDGRFVLFTSNGTNLVPNHTQGPIDVYLRDLVTNTTTLVSVNEGGRGNGDATGISITGDGRFALFSAFPRVSSPNDPVAPQLFVRDLQTGTTTVVGNRPLTLTSAKISENGRFVVFTSAANNLGESPDGGDYREDVYLRDIQLGVTERLSSEFFLSSLGDISADGQVVVFFATADSGPPQQIYVHDHRTGSTQQLIPGGGWAVDMDASGRFVLFETESTSLGIDIDTNDTLDVFLHDRQLRTTRLISHNVTNSASGDHASGISLSGRPLITDDGQTVVFTSSATDIVTIPKYVTPPSVEPYDDVYVSSIGTSGRLLNISTRGQVINGDKILIGGFILTGNSSKKIMVRALGPSLAAAGVAGALSDPTLELFDHTGALIASNDNWVENQAEIGATGLAPSSLFESALAPSLPPGAYTAVVRGKGGATGVGLVELYDLEPTATSELANISTRDSVDTGDNVLIAGVIAGDPGGGAARVLIRAIGPSLSDAGVAEALQNPALELRDFNGTLLAGNDDWKATQRPEIEETGIPPSRDVESAILQRLAPGAYTAIVRGQNNSTGIGLVEVYHLP
jgi:Tol biopolymer transport system component